MAHALTKSIARSVLKANVAISVFALQASAQFKSNGRVSDVARNLETEASIIGPAIGSLIQLVGFLFVIMAVMRYKKEGNQVDTQKEMGKVITTGVAGLLMLVLPFVIGIGITSFFGDGAAQSTTLDASNF